MVSNEYYCSSCGHHKPITAFDHPNSLHNNRHICTNCVLKTLIAVKKKDNIKLTSSARLYSEKNITNFKKLLIKDD